MAGSAALREHRVRAGDTLWSIAAAHRQEVSAAQMMLAIQRANPQAFARDNINLLRSGAVLRIPGADEAQSLARQEAEASVREQMVAWRTLSGAPAPAPTPVQAERIATAMPPRSAEPARGDATATATAGRLEIAPPVGEGTAAAQTGARVDGEGRELRAELQQTREELAARETELRDLRSRLTEQETLASEQQRLIELKNSQLSALEETLRRQREAEALAATPAAAATEVPAAAAAAAATETPAATTAAIETPAVAEAPTAAVVIEATPAAPPLAWWRQPLVLGGAGLLLMGGLLALLLRRRNPAGTAARPLMAGAATGRGRLSDDPDLFSGLPGPAQPENDKSIDSAPLDERGVSAAARMEDAEPFVPAHLENAEPLAHEAVPQPITDPIVDRLHAEIAASPLDLEAHVALLRQHYNAGDAGAFLAAAEAMRPCVGDTADPRWREVVVMGMGLVPGHALFREVLWNPMRPTDLQVREPAARPVASEPLDEAFDAAITAQRPALDVTAEPVAEVATESLDDTRIELAKAYIEIGDAEGARGMLEEVLLEGSPAARAEAGRLLKSIG